MTTLTEIGLSAPAAGSVIGYDGRVWLAVQIGSGLTFANGTITAAGGGPGGVAYTGTAPIVVTGSVISATIGTTANTLAAGNDSRITGAAPLASPVFTTSMVVPNVSVGVATAGAIVYDTTSGRFDFGIGGSVVNHVRLGGDTGIGVLQLAATPSANDNSLKVATTAYSDRAFTSTTPGAVPASGGGTANFLRADGTWSAPPGGGGTLGSTPKVIDGSTIPATSGAPYQMVTGDYVVAVNKTTGAATSITLPTSPTIGQVYYIVDLKGDATTNPITVSAGSGTVNGAASDTMNANYDGFGFLPITATSWVRV